MKNSTAPETTNAGYEAAAELFGVLSTPIRLRIIGALCGGEKNVSQLLQGIEVSQPNMSQQLNVLYRAGVVDKRRDGAQMYYRIADETVVRVCKAVCARTDDGTEGRKAQAN
ncbi:MAG: helix-turn-helix transcriptional regulator [Burkholderiales bacterium]|nr:helix-turn-helix transcriptional regulator [Burkholderiales bacterium]